MTDAVTTNYGWSYPTVGADASTWGTTLNATLIAIDAQVFLMAPLASPALTGNPTAPTQTVGNNSTRLATTAFVLANAATQAGNNTFTGVNQLSPTAAASPTAYAWGAQSVAAGTSNTAGVNWTFNASQGTGTGAGGSLLFQVAGAGSTGTAQNALATALTIDSTKRATFAGAATVTGTLTSATISNSGTISTVGLAATGAVSLSGAAAFSGGLTGTSNAQTTPSAVTFNATTMTLDCSKSNVFSTTFTASVTAAPTISNPNDGQTVNWFITQDGSGSRTMTWPTSFKWPGGSAGVLSTAASSVDLVVATYRAATSSWYASILKGFA